MVQEVREDPDTARILVVDGYPGLRVSMCEALAEAGYAVWAARCGQDGLKICERHPVCFDLLVTALDIVDMSGRELGKRLRSRCPDLRVIVMAWDDEPKGRAALCRPFSLATLERTVRRALGRRDAIAAAHRS